MFKYATSKNKCRYIDNNFDLDLSYITPRIIAMGYPASGISSYYRNDIKDVARFLNLKHPKSYMVFNLEGTNYDASLFEGRVCRYIWKDHNSPSLVTVF
jgi:hypothetical protein